MAEVTIADIINDMPQENINIKEKIIFSYFDTIQSLIIEGETKPIKLDYIGRLEVNGKYVKGKNKVKDETIYDK